MERQHTVGAQLPPLVHHLLTANWHQSMVPCTWNAKCSNDIFGSLCCHSCLKTTALIESDWKHLSWITFLPWEVDFPTGVSWKAVNYTLSNVNVLRLSVPQFGFPLMLAPRQRLNASGLFGRCRERWRGNEEVILGRESIMDVLSCHCGWREFNLRSGVAHIPEGYPNWQARELRCMCSHSQPSLAKDHFWVVVSLQHVQPAMHVAAEQPSGNSRNSDTRSWEAAWNPIK